MKVDSSFTKEQFEHLLAWLAGAHGGGGNRYEAVRRKLITLFLNRGCDEAEDLADETINRVAKKMPGLRGSYVGDPAHYFYGVAKNVFKEHLRECKKRSQPAPPPPPRSEMEPHLRCLDLCLAKLTPESRDLILRYYEEQKRAKITSHKEIGARLQLNANAVRARAFRIRGRLQKCVLECLERAGESNDLIPRTIQGWESFPKTGDED